MPGPPPRKLDNDERVKILDLLRTGFGLRMALAQTGVAHKRFYREYHRSAELRAEVQDAQEQALEQLVSLRYAQALGGDGRALDSLIGRADRAREFRALMRLRRAELQIRLAEMQSGKGQSESVQIDAEVIRLAESRARQRQIERETPGPPGGPAGGLPE